jgi:hypothetical protein
MFIYQWRIWYLCAHAVLRVAVWFCQLLQSWALRAFVVCLNCISLTLHVVVVYFSVINYKLITPTMLQRYWSRPASDKDNSTLHFNFFSFSITSKI